MEVNTCIIPARKGSRRLPGKNVRDFFGKPVIQYSVDCAKASYLFDHIIISTDSRDIGHMARDMGVGWHLRSVENSSDFAADADVIRECLKSSACDYLCYLYPVAPLLTPHHLVAGYNRVLTGPGWKVEYHDRRGRDAGAAYWIDHRRWNYDDYYTTDKEIVYLSDDECQDVNTEEDWVELERKYKGGM